MKPPFGITPKLPKLIAQFSTNFGAIFLFLFGFLTNAQETTINSDFIKTFEVKVEGEMGQQNIIELTKPFTVSFDDLNADERTYNYKFTHCNWDWKPSNLLASEFVEGYAQNLFLNFNNSFNTLVNYTHYSVRFPNQDTKIKISGNYLLSILNEDDEVVAAQKIVLYEQDIAVNATVNRSIQAVHFQDKQAVSFTLDMQKMFVNFPDKEIVPLVVQNNRLSQFKRQLKPQYMLSNQWVYQNNTQLEFWAGNEFLHFDTKSTINTNLNIKRIESLNHCHVFLYSDVQRSERTYRQAEDINGNYLIRNVDTPNALPSTEADYVNVHFSLESKLDHKDYDIHVIGVFNHWKVNSKNKMIYHTESNTYKLSLLLKQGFYNYDYVAVDKAGKIAPKAISGSFFETENDYKVIVYYKPMGARYSRVIGMGKANSLNSKL